MEVFRSLKRQVKSSFTSTEQTLNVTWQEDGTYLPIVTTKKGKQWSLTKEVLVSARGELDRAEKLLKDLDSELGHLPA